MHSNADRYIWVLTFIISLFGKYVSSSQFCAFLGLLLKIFIDIKITKTDILHTRAAHVIHL